MLHDGDADVHEEMCTYVVLSGNTTMFPSFGERVPNELTVGLEIAEVQRFAVHRQGVLRLLRHHKLSREIADHPEDPEDC